ncbi:MAG: hydroxylamine reductase [Planctomycetaceae bacterium]|nr:hydroxylamine reductase [Planctomycetaceae bacterium]
MYCYQCEQTAKGSGCTVMGVCGKEPTAAALQDLLAYVTKGISMYAHRAAALGTSDRQVDRAVIEFLFVTVTNVDFDPERLRDHLIDAAKIRDLAKALYVNACAKSGTTPDSLSGPTTWQPAADLPGLVHQGEEVALTKRQDRLGADVAGLQELILYGLKGAAAYADHAQLLGYEDPDVYATFHAALNFLAEEHTDQESLLGWVMKAGELNLTVMGLLDAANTNTYGHPEPTTVRVTPIRGKCIAVSGHDLKDLDELLKQTEGKGINVYTHGEMLPCHAYPGLKKYKHLVGNYGGAWQDQHVEFEQFPGAILMTTNCIQKPKESYLHRIFSSGLVAWPCVRHIGRDRDFTPVINAALAEPGFAQDAPEQTITVGFGHHAVLGAAEKIVNAVKNKQIRHFFLVGGCDGAKSGRNYYTAFAQQVPKDCVIMTLACGKYRFNKLQFGAIDGVPRLLDVGQCNDAYSAIKIATALADAFQCEVNQLPLSLILSWYEQKAVAILLTLLYLGIKNIRLGPSLPAFITPPVLKLLAEKFNIAPITTPEADLAAILG